MNTLAVPEKELQHKTIPIVSAAKTLTIRNNDHYTQASGLLSAIKAMRREIDGVFDPVIADAFKAHRSACAAKKKIESPLVEAESALKQKIGGYLAEQDRARREEEVRLRELDRKQREEMQLMEAKQLEDAGQHEQAEAVINEPVKISPIVLANPVPKVEGQSVREVWKFRIVDASKIPSMYMKPDEVKIGSVVRALKDLANIPGIEVYSEKSIAVKR